MAVNFTDPPVVEVALSVQFEPVEGLSSYRSGALYERWRADFPHVSQHAEVAPMPAFDTEDDAVFLMVGAGPTGSRLWFETPERTFLLQLQSDRLTVNWRRFADAPYPRYPAVRERLVAAWGDLTETVGATPRVGQVEVSYVNMIARSADEVLLGWDNPTCRQSDGQFRAMFEQSVDLADAVRATRQTTLAGRYGEPAQTQLTLVVRAIPTTQAHPMAAIDACRADVVARFKEITAVALHQEWGVSP